MAGKFKRVFGDGKPVIGMVHLGALPGSPLYDRKGGLAEPVAAEVLAVADGCIVGSSLKVDGDTWSAVDPGRAAEFMRLARAARGG